VSLPCENIPYRYDNMSANLKNTVKRLYYWVSRCTQVIKKIILSRVLPTKHKPVAFIKKCTTSKPQIELQRFRSKIKNMRTFTFSLINTHCKFCILITFLRETLVTKHRRKIHFCLNESNEQRGNCNKNKLCQSKA